MAIVDNAKGTTERNGTVVTTCLPNGQYKTDNDGTAGDGSTQGHGETPDYSRDVAINDIASINTRWDARFDDPTYYSA
tara:strand:- start:3070 stop:3303 length:234 start_codon:yes stop_codon:yes gene_type:complete